MYGHVITKFSRMGSLPHFLTHGAPLRAPLIDSKIMWALFRNQILCLLNRGVPKERFHCNV